MSDIEGETTRIGASERGSERVSIRKKVGKGKSKSEEFRQRAKPRTRVTDATPADDRRGLLSKQRKCSVRVGPDSRPVVTTVRQPDGPEIKVGI